MNNAYAKLKQSISYYSSDFMTEAYILINTEIGLENKVLGSLADISEIKEAHTVYGVYDIIARLETKTMEELKNLISRRIRRMEKIRSTLTMIVV